MTPQDVDDPLPLANCDAELATEIREANALTDKLSGLGLGGEMRILTTPAQSVTALLRSDAADVRSATASALVLINTDFQREQPLPVSLDPLPATAGIAAVAEQKDFSRPRVPRNARRRRSSLARLRQSYSESRCGASRRKRPSQRHCRGSSSTTLAPAIDGGRFAAKRIIGESHHRRSRRLYRWTRGACRRSCSGAPLTKTNGAAAEMRLLNNDRWQAKFAPDRIGRHEFTIEAWWDSIRHVLPRSRSQAQGRGGHQASKSRRAANCSKTLQRQAQDRRRPRFSLPH